MTEMMIELCVVWLLWWAMVPGAHRHLACAGGYSHSRIAHHKHCDRIADHRIIGERPLKITKWGRHGHSDNSPLYSMHYHGLMSEASFDGREAFFWHSIMLLTMAWQYMKDRLKTRNNTNKDPGFHRVSAHFPKWRAYVPNSIRQ